MAATVLKPHKNGFIVKRDRSLLLSLTASLIALVFGILTATVFYVSFVDVKVTELECSAENDLCVLKHSNGTDFRIEDINSASVRPTASVNYFGSPIDLSVLYLDLDNGQSIPLCSTQLNHPSVAHLNLEAEKVNHFLSDPEAVSVAVSCRSSDASIYPKFFGIVSGIGCLLITLLCSIVAHWCFSVTAVHFDRDLRVAHVYYAWGKVTLRFDDLVLSKLAGVLFLHQRYQSISSRAVTSFRSLPPWLLATKYGTPPSVFLAVEREINQALGSTSADRDLP